MALELVEQDKAPTIAARAPHQLGGRGPTSFTLLTLVYPYKTFLRES